MPSTPPVIDAASLWCGLETAPPLPPLRGRRGSLAAHTSFIPLRLSAECTIPPPYPLPSFQERRGSGKAYQNVFLIRKETAQLDLLDSLVDFIFSHFHKFTHLCGRDWLQKLTYRLNVSNCGVSSLFDRNMLFSNFKNRTAILSYSK